MFDEQSRYAGFETRTRTEDGGRQITYVVRRLIPPADSYVASGGITVTDSDRLDLIAHRAMGNSTAFWQVADANSAMHPQELTMTPGRRLTVPIPSLPGRRRL